MKATDLSTITAVGVLVAAIVVFLEGMGVTVPLWIPATIPLVAGIIIFGLRGYVAFVGADNTTVDEKLETAQRLIESARKMRGPASLATPEAIDKWLAKELPTQKDRPTVPPRSL